MSPNTEEARLASLLDYGVLDTPDEAAFDRLTWLAAELFDAPIALVSLIDADRQWFKSRVGLDATETHRDHAFCSHAIELDRGQVLVVTNAEQDARFTDNPLVTGDPNIRFYAGAVLTSPSGHNLGTLCVIDSVPRRRPSEKQLQRLKVLAEIVVDELELRRTRSRLNEKRRKLELAEAMSGIGHWRVEAGSRHVEWSEGVYRIHGVEPGSFSPNYDSALRFYSPSDEARVDAMVNSALKSGQAFSFEMTIRRADGAIRGVMSRGDAERDETGQITAVVGVFQDITATNDAMRALRTSQADYKLLADNVGDVISRNDLQGRRLYVSPSIKDLVGYTASEVLLMKGYVLVHPDDRASLRLAHVELARGANEQTERYRMVHKSGRAVWVENRLRLIRDAAGRPAEIIAVIRDISASKALETELLVAKGQAEAAAHAKSEFLANMSHELRTPLTSILGFSDLVATQPELSATSRDFLDRVRDGSRSLLCLVNDILDFSKLEAGQVSIARQPSDPVALCEATIALLAPQAGAKDLDVVFEDHAPVDLRVMIDPDRVRQVLLNLIGNAVKFTDNGSVTVSLGHAAGPETLRIDVTDTGPGLTPDQQSVLFQRFSQIDGELTRRSGGTGLGLAICKGLVEAMDGRIGVESTPGKGSRFWFELPAPTAAAGADVSAGVEPQIITSLAGYRILVADDNKANRELVRLFLTAVGVEVTLAENGRQAVELAMQRPFDALLLDIRMPVLDGIAACAEIRGGDGPNQNVAILAFTADVDAQAADWNGNPQFDGAVAKPIEAAELISTLSRAVNYAPVMTAERANLAN